MTAPREESNGVHIYQYFLDLNDMKDADIRSLQSCLKVVECPEDTARFVVQNSAQHRQFLTNAMQGADLMIVDLSLETVADADVSEFSETRLAGLLRQHNYA